MNLAEMALRSVPTNVGGMPTQVRLLTHRITVKRESPVHRVHAHDLEDGKPLLEEDAVYGLWQPDDSTITIDSSLGSELSKEVLLHENVHAILRVVRLDRDLIDAGLDDEKFVHLLTPVLLSWLRENPQMLDYLTEAQ